MTTHSLISLDSTDLWRDTLNDLDHGFAYTWEHCYAMRLTTGLDTHLYRFESGDFRVVGPFCERRFDGHVDIVKPFGFCGFVGTRSHPQFAASFREFARDSGYVCGYLGVDPLQNRDFGFEACVRPVHGTAHVLDISVGEQQLFRRLSTLRRRQLRHWDKVASAITEDQTELQDPFLDHYRDFMREKEAPGFYDFTRETLGFLVKQDNVFLVGARDEEGIAAVSVFGHTPTMGEYLFNVPLSDNGRRYAAPLIWQGIKRLRSMGVRQLSLGGSYADDGLYDFKRRFGGERRPVRHLTQVFDPKTFEGLCQRAGVNSSAAGFFPPYRQGRVRDGS